MALTMKRITDLQEKTEISDDDLIAVGNAGTASLRKTKWSTFWNNILTKIRGTIIVNNKVTTVEGYALDARMGKDFQKQIDDLNTKINKKYSAILMTSLLNGSGVIENFDKYDKFIISISASGFITTHYATKEMLSSAPIFVSSYYYDASQHGMASLKLDGNGTYYIASGLDQNSPSSSIAVYAR